MKHLKTYRLFENESDLGRISPEIFSAMQQRYGDFEKGLIRAWGGLLYLGYHNLPEGGATVGRDRYKRELEEYYGMDYDDPEFEDFEDWFSDLPPTIGGRPLFNKTILRDDFAAIARKTPAPFDLIVYRTSAEEEPDINSYTVLPGAYTQSGWEEGVERAYKIPKGTPMIFASDIADEGEVILMPTSEELEKWRI